MARARTSLPNVLAALLGAAALACLYLLVRRPSVRLLPGQAELLLALGAVALLVMLWRSLRTSPADARAREALRESERRYRTLLQALPQGVQETDTEGTIVFVNESCLRIYGYSEEEMLGRKVWDLVASEAERSDLRDYLRTLVSEQPPPTSYRGQDMTKDGRVRDIQVDWNYRRDDSGRVVGFISVLTDVTERNQAEQSLRLSEERFRTMADYTYDWEYWIGPDGNYIYVSPSCERITGYTPAEFHRDAELLTRLIHPDDRARVETHGTQVPDETGAVAITFRILTRDGRERWMAHVCQSVYGTDGTRLGRRASNRDITDSKRAEQEREQFLEQLEHEQARLQAIINSAPEGIVVVDREARILMVNPAADRLYRHTLPYGYQMDNPEAPRVCYPDGRPYEPRDLPMVRAALDGETHTNLEIALVWPGGERRDLLQNTAPIRDGQGRLTGAVGIFQDISEEHKFKAELVRRTEQLETLIREAHHRIRNNLQSVISLLELERDHVDAGSVGSLDRCASRIRAIAMVHRLLTSEATSRVPLQSLLKGLAELAQATYLGRGDRQIQIGVMGQNFTVGSKDATSLAIVVNELISNAILHAFPGRTSGRINVRVTGSDQGPVEITVSDNGCGCPEKATEGTGLLLARNIIEHDLRGEFRMTSSDQGCLCAVTFTL